LKKTVCLVLAGKRPLDNFSSSYGVDNKAFILLERKPLIAWVLDSLHLAGLTHKTLISIDSRQKELFEQNLASYNCEFLYSEPNSSPVDSVFKAFGNLNNDEGLLITTADNPLLSKEILHNFLQKCQASGAELIIGTVNGHDGLIERFPEMKRTWHKLNENTWLSGANLFYWKPKNFSDNTHQVMLKLESQRKSPIAFAITVSKIDCYFFMKLLTQQTTLDECSQALSKVTGIKIELVTLSSMEACIDVDKPEDLELAKLFLSERSHVSNFGIRDKCPPDEIWNS
jgi:molybdopterin-guanine dinucleotide biosynthesis protein A